MKVNWFLVVPALTVNQERPRIGIEVLHRQPGHLYSSQALVVEQSNNGARPWIALGLKMIPDSSNLIVLQRDALVDSSDLKTLDSGVEIGNLVGVPPVQFSEQNPSDVQVFVFRT